MNPILVISVFTLYALFLFFWLIAHFMGAPFYPSTRRDIDNIIDALQPLRGKNVAELGSGDGRIAIKLASQGANVTAIEINPFFTLLTRLKAWFSGVKIDVVQSDLFKKNYATYDAVVIYLYPKAMKLLEEKLFAELRPGSIVISNTFKFPNKIPSRIIDERVFVYEV